MQLHFVHERSSDPNAIPLIFSHGWPGSFIEAFKMIRKLTDPGAWSFIPLAFCASKLERVGTGAVAVSLPEPYNCPARARPHAHMQQSISFCRREWRQEAGVSRHSTIPARYAHSLCALWSCTCE